jgi:hypothetical protein
VPGEAGTEGVALEALFWQPLSNITAIPTPKRKRNLLIVTGFMDFTTLLIII